MTARELFTIEGPLCAIEAGGSHEVVVCPKCGRGRRNQVGELQVSLVCQLRHIWLSDGNGILVDQTAASSISAVISEGIEFRRVQATFRSDLPWANQSVPDLMQLVAKNPVSASSQSVELDGCSCGAVRSISFEPLVVLDPESSSGIWHLAENSEVLVLDEVVRDALLGMDTDLECLKVWREHEYSPPAPPLDGISWGDL